MSSSRRSSSFAHAVQPDPESGFVDPQGGAAQPARAKVAHLRGERATLRNDAQDAEPVAARTSSSHRAETAHAAWTAADPSPLASRRAEVARALDECMRDAWIRGDFGLSIGAVARLCGVTERQVRDWRDGTKALPVAALHLMPARLVEPLLERLQRSRGIGSSQKAVADLAVLVASLEQPAPSDRAEVRRAVADAMQRLAALLGALG